MRINKTLFRNLICLLAGAFSSCDIQFTDDHFPISSADMDMSKKNGVFVVEYSSQLDYILSPSSNNKLFIKEIFIEKEYRKRHSGEVELIGGEQIIIVTHNTIDHKFNLDWELRSTCGMHFTRCGPNVIFSALKPKYTDSVVLNIYDNSTNPEERSNYSNILTKVE